MSSFSVHPFSSVACLSESWSLPKSSLRSCLSHSNVLLLHHDHHSWTIHPSKRWSCRGGVCCLLVHANEHHVRNTCLNNSSVDLAPSIHPTGDRVVVMIALVSILACWSSSRCGWESWLKRWMRHGHKAHRKQTCGWNKGERESTRWEYEMRPHRTRACEWMTECKCLSVPCNVCDWCNLAWWPLGRHLGRKWITTPITKQIDKTDKNKKNTL